MTSGFNGLISAYFAEEMVDDRPEFRESLHNGGPDGVVDDGTRVESPKVYVETPEPGLTAAQARQLAAVILECADEIDGRAAQ